MVKISFNLLLIVLFSFFDQSHRASISGKDVLINDINKPYNQSEIEIIADLKAYSDKYGDLSNYIILFEDNYINNKEEEGVYIQKYKIDLDEYNDYYYELLIYNINFNKADFHEEITIKTNVSNYLSEKQLINKIKKELGVDIYNYELLNSNYIDNELEGSYLQNYLITTTNNKVINVTVLIDVVLTKTNYLPIIIAGILATTVIIYFVCIRKGKEVKL